MEEELEEKDREIAGLNYEIEEWKTKYKALELKKRESDIALNKIKTEINSLRSVDKSWKESAKKVWLNLNDVKMQFDVQVDQVITGLSGMSKAGERVTEKVPYLKLLKKSILDLQDKIRLQAKSIGDLNGTIYRLTQTLDEKTRKIKKLSAGIEEEVMRLTAPMRKKLADCMMQIMTEKAGRAQERRELADLWPEEHLMPSQLMRYRALTTVERERRVEFAQQQAASLAMSVEIRANVKESKSWTMEYDDYGRPFYLHTETGQKSEEEPAILSYKPPPGRNELGNIEDTPENDMNNWILQADNKGEVYYTHRESKEVTYIAPNLYRPIPKGRSSEQIAAEAAATVLSYIKEKILKHISKMQRLKDELENPMTPEEVAKKEKEERNKDPNDPSLQPVVEIDDENDAIIDLSLYQYDIETVELIAQASVGAKPVSTSDNPEEIRREKRSFLVGSSVRTFDKDAFIGPTLAETDLHGMDIPKLRNVVEDLSLTEEKLEIQIERIRSNLKDFSFVLMEKITEEEERKAREAKILVARLERQRREAEKQLLMEEKAERRRARKEKKEQKALRKALAEHVANGGDPDDFPPGAKAEREAAEAAEAALNPDAGAGGATTNEKDGGAVAVAVAEDTKAEAVATTGGKDETAGQADTSAPSADEKKVVEKKKKNKMDQKAESIEDGKPRGKDDLIIDQADDDDDDDDEDDDDLDLSDGEKGLPDAAALAAASLKNKKGKAGKNEKGDSDSVTTEMEALLLPDIQVNYGTMLFGDLSLNPPEPEYSEDLMQISTNLSNFAIFCGFNNLNPNESSADGNLEYSLLLDKENELILAAAQAAEEKRAAAEEKKKEAELEAFKQKNRPQYLMDYMSTHTGGDELEDGSNAQVSAGQNLTAASLALTASADISDAMPKSRSRLNTAESDVGARRSLTGGLEALPEQGAEEEEAAPVPTLNGVAVQQHALSEDDEWLTSSYFLTASKESIDSARVALSRSYDASIGLLKAGPMETEKLVVTPFKRTTKVNQIADTKISVQVFNESLERTVDKSYTPETQDVERLIRTNWEVWKSRQLMIDVLRVQIQQRAVNDAYMHGFQAFSDGKTQSVPHTSHLARSLLNVEITNIVVRNHPYKEVGTNNVTYVRIVLGPWVATTASIVPTPYPLLWENISLEKDLPVNVLQLDNLNVEMLDMEPLTVTETVVGSGSIAVNRIIGMNMGNNVHVQVDLLNAVGEPVGTATIVMTADFPVDDSAPSYSKPVAQRRRSTEEAGSEVEDVKQIRVDASDPTNLKNLQCIYKESGVQKVTNPSDQNAAVPWPGPRDPDGQRFSSLVSALRGDVETKNGIASAFSPLLSAATAAATAAAAGAPGNASKSSQLQVRKTTGCKSFADLLSGDVTVDDVVARGYKVDKKVVRRLPNFRNMSTFLEKKTNLHRWELEKMAEKIATLHGDIETKIKENLKQQLAKQLDSQKKTTKIEENAEDMKNEVTKIQQRLAELRVPNTMPVMKVFEDLKDPAYVPPLPKTGGLDERKKKKKQVPNAEFKLLMDKIDLGSVDGVEEWPIPEPFWPSQSQQIKINKAIVVRNKVLDMKQEEESDYRRKCKDLHQIDFARWEQREVERKRDVERTKKDSRRVNLKYEAFMEKVNRQRAELTSFDQTVHNLTEIKHIHERSAERYKQMRVKQMFEFKRQQAYIGSIKLRFLRAIKARRYALELPSSAKDEIQFGKLVGQSEVALRMLQVEILDCRQLLLAEGVRLRTLFTEEFRLYTNELSRARVSLELIFQREAFTKITARFKYDVGNLGNEMEKYRIAEAEKDEIGVDTVNDMGAKYVAGKTWNTGDINRVQKLLNINNAKIALTDSLGLSAIESQRCVLDMLTSRWSSDMIAVRDSWTENSDYERSKQLLHDTLQWLASERLKLKEDKEDLSRKNVDLSLQVKQLGAQKDTTVEMHELETRNVAESSVVVIEVMRDQLHEVRENAKRRIEELEVSIIDLSRDCQKIREELLGQQLLFEERTKLLWALIHTLQSTVQQIAVRMEIVIEERDKMVISAKLIAEKMRYQLRIERSHCSNLLFIIHSQKATIGYMQRVVNKLSATKAEKEAKVQADKNLLKREIWEHIFCFTRLCTDVDSLFEFFVSRLANLAGSRASANNAMAANGAAQVLAALCRSPRPLIRKCASRALGNIGWDGYVETRILLWDCVMFWKLYKSTVIARESKEYQSGLERFEASGGKMDAILNITGDVEEFTPSGNMTLRSIIKQRRQWALRATRRKEGPNTANQRLLNMKDGVIPALLQMSMHDGDDWEVARNAALAISVASYELTNHSDMAHSPFCVEMIIKMCTKDDPEVQTHAAVTLANLCHKDETAQLIFGNAGAVTTLLDMLEYPIVDVLEAATSALANLTSFCDKNCHRVFEADGIRKMVRIITESFSENLLDMDQNDEVHANASEMLANVSRFNSVDAAKHFSGNVLDALVVMCASTNKQLRRQVPLVVGNICQSEGCRAEMGEKGGVESLFLALEDTDTTVQANVLWALCNLMWHPPNQERGGRFMTTIFDFLSAPWEPIRTNASTLLANLLYYNNPNRVRFLEIDGSMEFLLDLVKNRDKNPAVLEGALRSLLSLSYLDAIALWLGEEGQTIPLFIGFLVLPYYTREAMRYSLEILSNLCLHHANRRTIVDSNGIEAVVALHIDEDAHIRETSVKIIEYLEDITPAEVLARVKQDIGLDRMVLMATNADPLVRAVAAESIGEEVWYDDKKKQRAQEVGAIDALLAIVAAPNEAKESVLPALWSLRNICQSNVDGQLQLTYRAGIEIVDRVIKRGFRGDFREQTEKVFEASLALYTVVVTGHEKHCRQLLMQGLAAVMDLADGALGDEGDENNEYLRRALRSESIVSLAKNLLLMLAPFNYIVCKNCLTKQDLHGTSCYKCGNRLLVDVELNQRNQFIPTKAARAVTAAKQGSKQPLSKIGEQQTSRTPSAGASKERPVTTTSAARPTSSGMQRPLSSSSDRGGSPLGKGSKGGDRSGAAPLMSASAPYPASESKERK